MSSPFFGSRKMGRSNWDQFANARNAEDSGHRSAHPKPNLSRPAPGHEVYPYLLRGVTSKDRHVWRPITYIPMRGGFSIWSR